MTIFTDHNAHVLQFCIFLFEYHLSRHNIEMMLTDGGYHPVLIFQMHTSPAARNQIDCFGSPTCKHNHFRIFGIHEFIHGDTSRFVLQGFIPGEFLHSLVEVDVDISVVRGVNISITKLGYLDIAALLRHIRGLGLLLFLGTNKRIGIVPIVRVWNCVAVGIGVVGGQYINHKVMNFEI